MKIKYKLIFHSLWHCGSGESKGADIDALVIKDENGLPYVPGKTIKGLIKDGMQELVNVNSEQVKQEDIWQIFGKEAVKNEGVIGKCFFRNASLPEEISEYLINAGNVLQKQLYTKLTTTAIDGQTGVAKDHSLRSMEAAVPMELFGEILDVPEHLSSHLEQAMQMVKGLGVGRNRGLGRCTFMIIAKEGGAK